MINGQLVNQKKQDYMEIFTTFNIILDHDKLFRMYKMWLINLTISLFSIIKTRALECVSVINRKCMPRPKILDVNEGVGEALFYPYNVLVNKCSGSCDTINNPMARLCVPNIIKRINMNF